MCAALLGSRSWYANTAFNHMVRKEITIAAFLAVRALCLGEVTFCFMVGLER